MSHFIEYYACGEHVRDQCRCPGPNKLKRISDQPCPYKQHHADIDQLRDGIQAILDERPQVIFEPYGPYLVAVPWRNRLRALLEPQQPPEPDEPRRCERCNERNAVYLLGKGIVVCNLCYQSPEDILKDLPREIPDLQVKQPQETSLLYPIPCDECGASIGVACYDGCPTYD